MAPNEPQAPHAAESLPAARPAWASQPARASQAARAPQSAQAPQPRRVCFLLRVRADRLEQYRERHAHVWPEMRAALTECGWRNYSLFLRDDGQLIGYLECDDFAACQAAMQERDVNRRWQAEMAPFFELEGASAPDAAMAPIAEIFHLD